MPDIDALEAVYDHILTHPTQHNQCTYGMETPCGTVHCAAGWALVLSGQYRFADGVFFRVATDEYVEPGPEAAELLGLDRDACWSPMLHRRPYPEGLSEPTWPPGIFSMAATLADIRRWIDHFRQQEGMEPRQFDTHRNIDLMERVWDQICEHPELHNQQRYMALVPSCGMAHCVGGWAAVLSGWTVRNSDNNSWSRPDGSLVESHQFAGEARGLLGLSAWEAWVEPALFESDRTPEQIRAGIDQFRVEAGLPKRTDAPAYRGS
jgi:hypothetical protein